MLPWKSIHMIPVLINQGSVESEKRSGKKKLKNWRELGNYAMNLCIYTNLNYTFQFMANVSALIYERNRLSSQLGPATRSRPTDSKRF